MANPSKMPKHGKAFALAYINNSRNATAAARTLPGISEKSAETIGRRLCGNVLVQAEISRLEKKLEDKTLITKERVLNELAIVGFADMQDYAEVLEGGVVVLKPWSQLPKGASRAVSKLKERRSLRADSEGEGEETIIDIQTEFGNHDKIKALAEISKIQGYYAKEQVDIKHSGTVSLAVEVVDYSKAVKPKNASNG